MAYKFDIGDKVRTIDNHEQIPKGTVGKIVERDKYGYKFYSPLNHDKKPWWIAEYKLELVAPKSTKHFQKFEIGAKIGVEGSEEEFEIIDYDRMKNRYDLIAPQGIILRLMDLELDEIYLISEPKKEEPKLDSKELLTGLLDLKRDIEKLETENTQLKSENRELLGKNSALESKLRSNPYFSGFSGIELDTLDRIYNRDKDIVKKLRQIYFIKELEMPSLSELEDMYENKENEPNGLFKWFTKFGASTQEIQDIVGDNKSEPDLSEIEEENVRLKKEIEYLTSPEYIQDEIKKRESFAQKVKSGNLIITNPNDWDEF